MYLILAISKSTRFKEAIKTACSGWDKDSYHIDTISSSPSLIGYFPENVPAAVFIDADNCNTAYLRFLLTHLPTHYPNTLILVSSQKPLLQKAPSDRISFYTYTSSYDLQLQLLKLLKQVKKFAPVTPDRYFYPLKNSRHYFEQLKDAESAFELRNEQPKLFASHQFYVCILHHPAPTKNNSWEAFAWLYDTYIQQTKRCLAYQLDAHTAILVFYEFTDNIQSFSIDRDQLIARISKAEPSANEPVTFHIGCIHSGCFGLYKSYFEAKETWYINKLYTPSVSFDEISNLTKQAAKPMRLIEIERLIRANIEYKNGANLIQYVKLWFQECKNMGYTLENIQIDLLNLYSSIKYVIFDMYTLHTLRIKKGWEPYELFRIESIDELEEWFYTWITYTLNNLSGKQAGQRMRIQDAADFIENHLLDDISLETVSSYFFLNPSYFSTIFKQEMNETFSSYVIRKKMQKAAEMLQGDRKISEIAGLLGYEDQKHFRMIFKKQFHKSPAEYRKMFQQAKNR